MNILPESPTKTTSRSFTFVSATRMLVTAIVMTITPLLRAGTPEPVSEGGLSLVVIPDSQKYIWKRPELYALQAGWVSANIERHRLAMLLHVGDITQRNTHEQWRAARRAHQLYSGLLPAAYAAGNHDYGLSGETHSRQSYFSDYITLDDYRAQAGFGGVYDREPSRTENSWHTFEGAGRGWLVLVLEFAPRDDVLHWANEIVAANPDRSVIIVTHAYLLPDATRYDRTQPSSNPNRANRGLDHYTVSQLPGNGGFNDAEDMWQKLVSRHANIVLVICGHICTSAHLVSQGVHGNTVHQLLVDYQDADNGGNGWLRLLQIQPDGRTMRVRDYSPLLDKTSTEANCAFEFVIDAPRVVTKR